MEPDNGDWLENRKFVLETLARLDSKTADIQKRLVDVAVCLEGQKVRTGLISTLFGVLGGGISAALLIMSRLMK